MTLRKQFEKETGNSPTTGPNLNEYFSVYYVKWLEDKLTPISQSPTMTKENPYPDYLGFLHNHPHMEESLKLDNKHVIVDRYEWEKARNGFVSHIHEINVPINLPTKQVPDEEIRKVFYNLCTNQAYTGYAVIREDIFIKVVRGLLTNKEAK